MDKPDIWMPHYIGDYSMETIHFSAQQDGLYMRLQRYYWKNCGKVPDDLDLLCRAARVSSAGERADLEMILESFFIRDREKVRHAELDKRYKLSVEQYAKTSAAGKKAVEAREEKKRVRLNCVSNDTSIVDQTITRPITTSIKRTRADSHPEASGDEPRIDPVADRVSEQEFRRLYQLTFNSVLNESHENIVKAFCRVIPKKVIEYIFSQVPNLKLEEDAGILDVFLDLLYEMKKDPTYCFDMES